MSSVQYDFRERTVIVAGAGRGIGRAIGAQFTAAAADVWLVDVDGGVVRETAAELRSNWAGADVAVTSFTKTAANELARFGVTVNAFCPNAETRMFAEVPAAKRAQIEAQIPLGRFADPQEISSTVAFLASEDANDITGAVVRVDGGLAM